MKIKITAFFVAVIVSGCGIVPTTVIGPSGKNTYTMYCSSGIDKCYQKSGELCPDGYDVIEISEESSTLVPHYGEYPEIVIREYLTIQCS